MRQWNVDDVVEGRFVVRRVMGGGMADLFIAEDRTINRLVVLKTPRGLEASDWEAFQNEADVAMGTRRANFLVTIYSAEKLDGRPCIIMEYVDGGSLRDKIGSLSPVAALDYALQVSFALMTLHDFLGILHRDLKPENVLLTSHGIARVTDFGLGSLFHSRSAGGNKADSGPLQTLLGGTYPYMAPELWSGRDAGRPTDTYAFGIMLWEMLTGRTPFRAGTVQGWMEHHSRQWSQPVSQYVPEVKGTGVDEVVASCLIVDPTKRAESFHHILKALEQAYLTLAGTEWKTSDEPDPEIGPVASELSVEDRLHRARVLYREKQTEDAIAELQVVLTMDMASPAAWFLLGNCLARLSRHREAIEAFTRAAALLQSVEAALAITNIGNSLLKLGEFERAADAFEFALTLDPTDIVATANLPIARTLAAQKASGGNIRMI